MRLIKERSVYFLDGIRITKKYDASYLATISDGNHILKVYDYYNGLFKRTLYNCTKYVDKNKIKFKIDFRHPIDVRLYHVGASGLIN